VRKPKGLNKIAKIGKSHLCLREENVSNVVIDSSVPKFMTHVMTPIFQ